MPFSMKDLTHRDRTTHKVPAGIGAFTGGGGFGLFVSVPVALFTTVTGAVLRKVMKKKQQKEAEVEGEEDGINDEGRAESKPVRNDEGGPKPAPAKQLDDRIDRTKLSVEKNRPERPTSPGLLDV